MRQQKEVEVTLVEGDYSKRPASGVRRAEGGRDICVRLHVQDGATRDMDALLQLGIVGGRRRQALVSASTMRNDVLDQMLHAC